MTIATNHTQPRRRLVAALAAVVSLAAMACVAVPASAAAPGWRMLAATGPTNLEPYVNDRQSVTVRAHTGTFNLTYEGSTTNDIAAGSPPAVVAAELNALPSIGVGGGSVSVTGGEGKGVQMRPYVVEFDGGPLAGNPASMLEIASGTPPLPDGVEARVDLTDSAVLAAYPANVGSLATSGTVTVTVGPLPAGIETAGPAGGDGTQGSPWTCPGTTAGQSTATCTRTTPLVPLAISRGIVVPLRATASAPASSSVNVTVSGGGATEGDTYQVPLTVSNEKAEPGIAAMWAGAFDADGQPYTQAGGHPHSAGSMFINTINRNSLRELVPAGDPKDLVVDLPAGFIGNPMATAARCPASQIGCNSWPLSSKADTFVGRIFGLLQQFPNAVEEGETLGPGTRAVTNDVPPTGYPAHFTYPLLDARAILVPSLRSEDYGVRVTSPNITPYFRVHGSFAILDGTAPSGKAFLTNPTECSGSVVTTWMSLSSWQAGNVFSEPFGGEAPAVTGCGAVPFDPVMIVEPTVSAADSATGLRASIDVPQEGLLDPDELATAHLKKTVVELPEGVAVNPSSATGLEGCTDAEIGMGNDDEPSCPAASKIGTAEVTTPLLDEPLDGVLYLGTPKSTDPQSGDMLRLFLVVDSDRFGITVKVAGSTVADPQTGRLTATFDQNPRVPFDRLEVELRGGSRGVLATPQDCGEVSTTSTLSPWSGTEDVVQPSPFDISGGCSLGFAPKLTAGMDNPQARGNGTFSFRFSREDGEQWVDGLTAKLPKGLLASVKGLPLCSDGQAAAGACPEASRIGTVDATAGSGNPFVLERKGTAYLTEGYKGCSYGLLVSVPVVAGPFDGSSPETDLGSIDVRQAVCVDRSTAEVTAISDPLPTIWHGIPVRTRSVTVLVDRPAFMLNPSGCGQKQVGATFDSDRGATADAASGFAASGCSSLAFKPKLTLALTGRKQIRTGKHPGVRAQVTQQGVGEAGIERAEVRLPKSLALDVDNAQALCEFEDGTKPDLENHCPKGSIVGRARAVTPLLNEPLVGNVYFVKNIRRDPKTGNEIRTLPMIIAALRGEIAINLKGTSDTKGGKLVSIFDGVPDAPVSQFNLNIAGGKNGIIAVTRTRRALINLCAKPRGHIAESDMDGQNGKRHDRNIRMKTPCAKKQIKAAKRQAKRAARAHRR